MTKKHSAGVAPAPAVRLGEHNGGDYDMRHQAPTPGVPEPKTTDGGQP